MSSTALKTLAVILVVAAAVLGFVAYYFSQGLTEAPETAEREQVPQPAENQVLAVVATRRLPPYQPIAPEAVALLPISVQPPQHFTDVGEVVGRTPLRAVPVGSPVTEEAFGKANTLSQAIPAGSQAMSLEISDVIAVGGFVRPGDMVDVLVYIRASGREVEDSQARVLLENARVLGYDERLINVDAEPADDNGNDRQQRRQRTAVVAVPVEDTTRVMLGASLGELRLSLRGEPEPRVDVVDVGAAAAGDAEAAAATPEALAPSAQQAAAQPDEATDKRDEGESDSEKSEERVITLRELTAIKDKRKDDKDQPKPPPRAVIEVYMGTDSHRISRPY